MTPPRTGSRALLTITFAAIVALSVVGCGGKGSSGDLLIRADRVFDGERVIENGAVLVSDGRIDAVGGRDELDARAARTIELGDATLLPGLIDLHVHIADSLAGELILASGVTTVRDVGAPIASLPPPAPRLGRLRLLSAGPILTVSGGYPIPVHGAALGLPVNGTAQARAAVARLANAGAAVIKIAVEQGFRGEFPILDAAEIRAIVEAAHAHKLRVTAHVTRTDDARLALDGGVDELAHMPCFGSDPALMQELAEREVAIVGTLHVEQTISCPDILANARAFVAAGGRLLYGSDMGNPGIPFGLDVDELRLLRKAGLSPLDVLRAATSRAARALGDETLGRLAPGAAADLVAVRGNPLFDLDRMRDVSLVIAGGEVVVEDGLMTAGRS